MPDYNHDIEFGAFITPSARRPQTLLDLTLAAETAGLDLATFQDHPYQAEFLETWTLLSWLAGQTTAIRLMPNVISLPLREPALLARQSTTLDILSYGRVEIGLGAGAFWDPIVGMGGPRRSPGEARRAVAEAIDLMRQVWNPGTRTPARVSGSVYTVPKMTRGPQPPHQIPIHIGAYGPKMLELTGQKADGWVPSMGYVDIQDLPDANARIDAAAEAAGRAPSAIRRMLNINGAFLSSNRGFLQGPPRAWAEQLTELALDGGFGTFILGASSEDTLRTFGEEVAPDVRERVSRARSNDDSSHSAPPVIRRTSRKSTSDIPEALDDVAVTSEDRGYDRVRSTYMSKGSPAVVFLTETEDQIRAALDYARSKEGLLSIRSGGHGSAGFSTNDGGTVIDISNINDIEVIDAETRRVRVGAGATWGMVARELAPYGMAMTSGDFPDVGVGGIVTAGGVGLLARKYGLTIDNVVSADIILADGSLVHTSHNEHPELFWGIRGAGANLGIVTHVEMDALPVSNVIAGSVFVDATLTANVIHKWGQIMENAPRELQSFLYLTPQQGSMPTYANMMFVWSNDDVAAASPHLNRFLEVGPVLQEGAQVTPYAAIMAPQNQAHSGQQRLMGRSAMLDHLDMETSQAVERLMLDGSVPWATFRHVGGAVNDVPADATAYAHRTQQVVFTAFDMWGDRRRLDPAFETFAPYAHGTYINLESAKGEAVVRAIYPSPTYERIQKIKTEVDPDNVFSNNFNVPPLG